MGSAPGTAGPRRHTPVTVALVTLVPPRLGRPDRCLSMPDIPSCGSHGPFLRCCNYRATWGLSQPTAYIYYIYIILHLPHALRSRLSRCSRSGTGISESPFVREQLQPALPLVLLLSSCISSFAMPCIVAQPQLSALRVVQAAKKRDFMTGSTVVHSEVRSSMLSSARIAFTQQYGESAPSLHQFCWPHKPSSLPQPTRQFTHM